MTHVILGAKGQIGSELAKSLHADHANTIRLVSRNPRKVNNSHEMFSADFRNLLMVVIFPQISSPVLFRLWEDIKTQIDDNDRRANLWEEDQRWYKLMMQDFTATQI